MSRSVFAFEGMNVKFLLHVLYTSAQRNGKYRNDTATLVWYPCQIYRQQFLQIAHILITEQYIRLFHLVKKYLALVCG